MVTLLYGDDQIRLRWHLDKLKEDHQGWEVVNLDLISANEEDVFQALYSDPLFACGRLVVLENWFSPKVKKPDLAQINKNVDVIILEKSKVAESQIKDLPPETQILLFREDPIVFRFLDSIFAGNKRRVFYLYTRTIAKKAEPEMLYHLLVSHLRRVLLAKETDDRTLRQIENLAPWQIEKYKNLSQRFKKEKLIACYRRLLDLEQASKTSSNLNSLLPIFILELTQSSDAV